MWIEVNNLYSKIIRATDDERSWLDDYLSFTDREAFFRQRKVPVWKRTNKVKLLNMVDNTFPSGFVVAVQKAAIRDAIQVQLVDRRVSPISPDPTALIDWLRDYQAEAVALVQGGTERGIFYHATGAGKTEIAVALTEVLPCTWLFLTHRADLVQQTVERFALRTGEEVGFIGEGVWNPKRITIAMFQSIYAGRDKPRTKHLMSSVQGIMIDECFPAGTLIDGRPIEMLRRGDLVTSLDERTGCFVKRRINQVFCSPMRQLVRVHFADGRSVVSTSGHPFLTSSGWCPASALCGNYVLCLTYDTYHMHSLPRAIRSLREGDQTAPSVWCDTDEMLQVVHSQGTSRPICPPSPRADGTCAAIGEDAWHTQSDGQAWRVGEGVRNTENSWRLAAEDSGRQRLWSYCSTEGSTRSFGGRVVGRIRGPHEEKAEQWPTDSLQDRHSASILEDRCGGRRGDAQGEDQTRVRRHKGQDTCWVRVVGVEILESRDPAERERLCPGGVVYNLHVEGTETFVVNGAIVHNCHVIPADTFWHVAMHTPAAYYRYGFSGTPFARSDKKSLYTWAAIGGVIHTIRADELIKRGVLARPKVRLYPVRQRSMEKTWLGVYRDCVANSIPRNAVLVQVARTATKPCLLFVREIKHGRMLESLLRTAGERVEFVWGKDHTTVRRAAIRRLVHGDVDILICSVIFQEGIDIPELQSVIIGQGGKSIIATLQDVGRGMRRSRQGEITKEEFEVHDIEDRGCGCTGRNKHHGCRWLERHARQRVATYTKEKFETIIDRAFVGAI